MTAESVDRNNEIIRRHRAGETQAQLAKAYGLHQSRISRIVGKDKPVNIAHTRRSTERRSLLRVTDSEMRKRLTNHHRLIAYGVTAEKYEEMLATQDHLCAICGQPETWTRSGVVKLLSIDHDHNTGKVRALLCTNCNVMLGHAKENAEILRLGALYLERHGS